MTRGSLPPGRQWYDPLNGIRVGGLAGAIVGGVVTALLGIGYVWLVVAGAVAGGAAGFLWERRSLRRGTTGNH